MKLARVITVVDVLVEHLTLWTIRAAFACLAVRVAWGMPVDAGMVAMVFGELLLEHRRRLAKRAIPHTGVSMPVSTPEANEQQPEPPGGEGAGADHP